MCILCFKVRFEGTEVDLRRADADAILQQFYPGELGGLALAEVIFGDVNPSGE